MFDFGLVIRELRQKCGYSQISLGKRLGVSGVTVGRWEKNNVMPGTEKLIELSMLYGVSLNFLLGMPMEKVFYIDRLTPDKQKLIRAIVGELRQIRPDNGVNKRQENVIDVQIKTLYK